MSRFWVITLDWWVAVWKSTTAKSVSRELDIPYLDTWEMYRIVTYICLEKQIEVTSALVNSVINDLSFEPTVENNKLSWVVNGRSFSDEIRTILVSTMLWNISKHQFVRDKLISLQRELSTYYGSIIADGRDLGTVVFPDSINKFFMTCSDVQKRVLRRYSELQSKWFSVTLEEVFADIKNRDNDDYYWENPKFSIASDVRIIDTNKKTIKQQTNELISLLEMKEFS